MRKKYNVFDPHKITTETIRIALQLKKQLPPGIHEVKLRDTNFNLVPTGDHNFLEWMSAKYLKLSYEDGIPLLKKAMQQQYNIDDEYKLCKYCNKPFPYIKVSKEFCNHKCQMRFKRWGKKTDGVTLSRISSDKENSKSGVMGMLPLKRNLSVTENDNEGDGVLR